MTTITACFMTMQLKSNRKIVMDSVPGSYGQIVVMGPKGAGKTALVDTVSVLEDSIKVIY